MVARYSPFVNSAPYHALRCSFLTVDGPAGVLESWAALDPATQSAAVAYAHSKGAVVLVSIGGATESPYGQDPTAYGRTAASWALANAFDGVDYDLENFQEGQLYKRVSCPAL